MTDFTSRSDVQQKHSRYSISSLSSSHLMAVSFCSHLEHSAGAETDERDRE